MKSINGNMPSKMTGASLIEVLVAFLILGVGLLGVMALQVESQKMSQQSYASTQALLLANDMAERMRGNRESFITYNAVTDTYTRQVPNNSELTSWQALVSESLTGGVGVVTDVIPGGDEAPYFEIEVSYDEVKFENETPEKDGTVADNIKRINYLLAVGL